MKEGWRGSRWAVWLAGDSGYFPSSRREVLRSRDCRVDRGRRWPESEGRELGTCEGVGPRGSGEGGSGRGQACLGVELMD